MINSIIQYNRAFWWNHGSFSSKYAKRWIV